MLCVTAPPQIGEMQPLLLLPLLLLCLLLAVPRLWRDWLVDGRLACRAMRTWDCRVRRVVVELYRVRVVTLQIAVAVAPATGGAGGRGHVDGLAVMVGVMMLRRGMTRLLLVVIEGVRGGVVDEVLVQVVRVRDKVVGQVVLQVASRGVAATQGSCRGGARRPGLDSARQDADAGSANATFWSAAAARRTAPAVTAGEIPAEAVVWRVAPVGSRRQTAAGCAPAGLVALAVACCALHAGDGPRLQVPLGRLLAVTARGQVFLRVAVFGRAGLTLPLGEGLFGC